MTQPGLQYKVYDRMRHPRAFEVARQPGTAGDFEALRGARQCLVVTFKRSGEPVPAVVNFGVSDDGELYFRTEPHVGKVKRLSHDPHVRVSPCNLRGRPLGPVTDGTARIVPVADVNHAHSIVASNWSPPMALFERFIDRTGVPLVYVAVAPIGPG